jgi:hypothetical protein
LASIGREGLMGMIGVDKIGEIRRAYFEQGRPIKEIVRALLVSRATVRKVIRGHRTEFKYEREVQPSPKLGSWIEVLTEILEKEGSLPKRERRSTQRVYGDSLLNPESLACPELARRMEWMGTCHHNRQATGVPDWQRTTPCCAAPGTRVPPREL